MLKQNVETTLFQRLLISGYSLPAKTTKIEIMLVYSLRRWPNIKPTFISMRRVSWAHIKQQTLIQSYLNVDPSSLTGSPLCQH